jgi:hypothetical protein
MILENALQEEILGGSYYVFIRIIIGGKKSIFRGC